MSQTIKQSEKENLASSPKFRYEMERLLLLGKINRKSLHHFTDEESMKIFEKAFTHPSYSKSNYEILEFIGDGIINGLMAKYVVKKFPEVQNEGLYTVIRQKMQSGAELKRMLLDRGLDAYLRYDISDVKLSTLIQKREGKQYEKIISSVFEALIGAVEEVVNRKMLVGVGYAVTYNLCFAIFDDYIKRHPINPTYKDLSDYKTKLNILYSREYKWGGSGKYIFTVKEGNKFKTDIHKGNQDGKLGPVIATGYGYSKQISQNHASKLALEYFENEQLRRKKRA